MKRIGLSNGIFGRRNPTEGDFLRIREAGVRKVEISMKAGWFDMNDRMLAKDTLGWLKKYGLEVNSVHGPTGLPGESVVYGYSGFSDWIAHPKPKDRKQAVEKRKKAMDIACRLGAEYFIVEYECYPFWPFWPHGSMVEDWYPRSESLWEESMEALLGHACKKGIIIAVENIDGFGREKLPAYIKDKHPGHAGICFDTSHATYDGLFESLALLRDRMVTTHVSDNAMLEGTAWTDGHLVPFTGKIDWEGLIAGMEAGGYKGAYILEINPRYSGEVIALRNAVERLGGLLEARG